MTNTLLTSAQWAVSEFALAELGDQRRTQRLVKIATNLARNPGGTLPQAFPEWTDLKAAYRFFDQPKVTFEQIQSSHWQRTREACHQPGEYLLYREHAVGKHFRRGNGHYLYGGQATVCRNPA